MGLCDNMGYWKYQYLFTPLGVLESLRLHVSSDQFVSLLLSSYCCLFSNSFFFVDPHPSPALEEKEAIHIDTFNSLSEKQLDFKLLVTMPNSRSAVSIPAMQLYRRTLGG